MDFENLPVPTAGPQHVSFPFLHCCASEVDPKNETGSPIAPLSMYKP